MALQGTPIVATINGSIDGTEPLLFGRRHFRSGIRGDRNCALQFLSDGIRLTTCSGSSIPHHLSSGSTWDSLRVVGTIHTWLHTVLNLLGLTYARTMLPGQECQGA